ncbi:MAG: type II toxin-antitoxin system RelE/ParE family toxin [Verrucomicrobia bacterium]|jgi:plasmid stabilization system protein ParE|nr:type II toxin-antitoxin system RelE/ParE family toxin [Verrucomicrobiota bacterium]
MLTPKNHPLVGADFQSAYSWSEEEVPGLGVEFAGEFRRAYQKLRRNPLLYSVRFSGIRRLNLDRFPYGIFYVVKRDEVRVLAVLHGSRETKRILSERRRTFSSSQT